MREYLEFLVAAGFAPEHLLEQTSEVIFYWTNSFFKNISRLLQDNNNIYSFCSEAVYHYCNKLFDNSINITYHFPRSMASNFLVPEDRKAVIYDNGNGLLNVTLYACEAIGYEIVDNAAIPMKLAPEIWGKLDTLIQIQHYFGYDKTIGTRLLIEEILMPFAKEKGLIS